MQEMKRFINLATLFMLVVMTVDAKLPEVAEASTAAPPVKEDIRAYTINPEDGSEVLLAMPNKEKCWDRGRSVYGVAASDTHSAFWVSLVDPAEEYIDPNTNHAFNKSYTWIEARNKCREKCMELATLDTFDKNHNLATLLEFFGVDVGVWAAGKRCLADECAAVEEPIHLNGWYWSTTGAMLHSAHFTEEGWLHNPWSNFGVLGRPQPDNSENLLDRSVIEACLAVGPDPDTHKMGWNDVACNKKLGVVCEEDARLVEYVERNHNVPSQAGY